MNQVYYLFRSRQSQFAFASTMTRYCPSNIEIRIAREKLIAQLYLDVADYIGWTQDLKFIQPYTLVQETPTEETTLIW